MNMDTVDRLNGLFHEYLEYFAGQMSFHRLNTRMSALYCAYGLSKNLAEQTSYHTPRIYTGEFQNVHTKNGRKRKTSYSTSELKVLFHQGRLEELELPLCIFPCSRYHSV